MLCGPLMLSQIGTLWLSSNWCLRWARRPTMTISRYEPRPFNGYTKFRRGYQSQSSNQDLVFSFFRQIFCLFLPGRWSPWEGNRPGSHAVHSSGPPCRWVCTEIPHCYRKLRQWLVRCDEDSGTRYWNSAFSQVSRLVDHQ